MAKQRGIHQISGTINNLCYYEQKYVRGGLIRRVNEAMSGRLKTDPVFENTRLASSVFGMCSILSAQIMGCFGYRPSFLFRPSRQAKFTKFLLSLYQSQYGKSYRQVLQVDDNFLNTLPMFLNTIIKSRLSDYGIFLGNVFGGEGVGGSYSVKVPASLLQSACLLNGVEELNFIVRGAYNVPMPQYDPESKKYIAGLVTGNNLFITQKWKLGDPDLELNFGSGITDTGYSFSVVSMRFVVGYVGLTPIYLEGRNALSVVSFKNN